ncbi:MAG TPA: LysM peptidoglycan-binding domain-containing protein [Planctomycetota bacterium]|nr:LysM peptidoglycan-binding domain-containing protein [Planctomycetota bacterium]
MSTGFRIFLLMLFAFGAIWAHRFRSRELILWLEGAPPAPDAHESPRSLVSPVDGLLALDVSWALLRGKDLSPPRGRRVRPPAVVEGFEEEPSFEGFPPGADTGAADLSLISADPSGVEAFEVDPALVLEEEGGPAGEQVPIVDGEGAGTEPPEHGIEAPPVLPDPSAISGYNELTYEVEEGDSLWKIAAKTLGSGARCRDLVAWNPGAFRAGTPDVVTPGMTLKIRIPADRKALKVSEAKDDRTVEESSGPREDLPPARTLHAVKRNENLQKIAGMYYPRNTEGWRAIFEANRDHLDSPDRVREGQVLVIPALAHAR